MDWSFRNDLPIYTQLEETIKLAIVSGELPPGARLSAVRELSLEAGVNPNTMQRALQELEREGLVYAQRTAGRFVTEDAAAVAALKTELARQQVRTFLAAMGRLGYDRGGILALLEENQEVLTAMERPDRDRGGIPALLQDKKENANADS